MVLHRIILSQSFSKFYNLFKLTDTSFASGNLIGPFVSIFNTEISQYFLDCLAIGVDKSVNKRDATKIL